jgi:putative Mn2+ efflux pump MntP
MLASMMSTNGFLVGQWYSSLKPTIERFSGGSVLFIIEANILTVFWWVSGSTTDPPEKR